MKKTNQKFSNMTLSLIVMLLILFSVFIADILEFDNFLYHQFKISPPLDYYDLYLWDFYQAIGTLGAFIFGIMALVIAYETWSLESEPDIQAIGIILVSLDKDTNGVRDMLIEKYNSTFSVVNVGRGPAKNIVLSVSENTKGYLLEDICPDTFPLSGNSQSSDMDLSFSVYGQRFVKSDKYELDGNENIRSFCIHYQDHKNQKFMTKVQLKRVLKFDHEISDAITANQKTLQLWKINENQKITF